MFVAYHKELGEVIFHERLSYKTELDEGFVNKVSKGKDLIFIFDEFLDVTKEEAIPEKTDDIKFVDTNNQIEKAIRKNTITFKKIKEMKIDPKFKSVFSVEKLKGIKI